MTDSTGYGLLSTRQKKKRFVPRYDNGCSVSGTTSKSSGRAVKLQRNFGIIQQ